MKKISSITPENKSNTSIDDSALETHHEIEGGFPCGEFLLDDEENTTQTAPQETPVHPAKNN